MICPYCGKVNFDSDSICLYCGKQCRPQSGDEYDGFPFNSGHTDVPVYSMDDTNGNEWHNLRNSAVSKQQKVLNQRMRYLPTYAAVLGLQGMKSTVTSSDRPVNVPPSSGTTVLNEDDVTDPMLTIHPGYTLKKAASDDTSVIIGEEELLRAELEGKYEIERKLGSGGMATVYLAHEIALERPVAIKNLSRAFTHDEMFVTRFKLEAKIAAALEHPNIVRIYSISGGKESCYFVMSYIPGGSLSNLLKSGEPLETGTVVRLGRDICSALSYAHNKGVIHRDLKPDNIMIASDKSAVLTDFGIAHSAAGTTLTLTGQVLGTPQYMSPEQALGKDVDVRSDIYSLGVVFYQMVTGRLPFRADDAVSLMYMHVHEKPEPPSVNSYRLPRWLRKLVIRCMEKDPDDRYGSTEEIICEIDAHVKL